jgi:hypothetical protein
MNGEEKKSIKSSRFGVQWRTKCWPMEASCLSIVLPVRQCAHFFTRCSRRSSRNKLCFGAPALSALVAPVICQHICRRPKPFHSMAMTLELQRPLIRSDPIRKTPQKTTAKKRGYKKERGKRFFLSLSLSLSSKNLVGHCSFSLCLFISPFQTRFLEIGTLVSFVDPRQFSDCLPLQLINLNHLGFCRL